MNKKILSIIFSLFLVGVFSISCSSKEDPKGIEQFNGNTYVSTETFDVSVTGSTPETFDISVTGSTIKVYLCLTVQDGKVGMYPDVNNATAPDFLVAYMNVEGSGADYTFDSGYGNSGTLKFTDTSVTVKFRENAGMFGIKSQDIVCNKNV